MQTMGKRLKTDLSDSDAWFQWPCLLSHLSVFLTLLTAVDGAESWDQAVARGEEEFQKSSATGLWGPLGFDNEDSLFQLTLRYMKKSHKRSCLISLILSANLGLAHPEISAQFNQ